MSTEPLADPRNRLRTAAETACTAGIPLIQAAESFAGADLAGADLSSAIADAVDFSDSHLADADLSFASLLVADLSGADLRRARLVEVCLLEAELCGADLTGADLRGASFFRSRIDGTRGGLLRLSLPGLCEATLYPSCDGWVLAVELDDDSEGGDSQIDLEVPAYVIGAEMEWTAQEAGIPEETALGLASSAPLLALHIASHRAELEATAWARTEVPDAR